MKKEPIGECVYQRKTCPYVEGFILGEAVQRICGLEHVNNMCKPSAVGLTVSTPFWFNPIGGFEPDSEALVEFIY